jgi:hypothetical protein
MKNIQLSRGQTVTIYNNTIGGKKVIEGKAKLVEFVGKGDNPPYAETWVVAFEGDGGETFTRDIIPE